MHGDWVGDDLDSTVIIHNAAWYNEAGTFLGQGDLTREEVIQEHNLIRPGSLMIVINRDDFVWTVGSGMSPETANLGFVAAHAAWIIRSGEVFYVDRFGNPEGPAITELIFFQRISPQTAAEMIQSSAVL